jgi:hypothetical protein
MRQRNAVTETTGDGVSRFGARSWFLLICAGASVQWPMTTLAEIGRGDFPVLHAANFGFLALHTAMTK